MSENERRAVIQWLNRKISELDEILRAGTDRTTVLSYFAYYRGSLMTECELLESQQHEGGGA